MVVVVLELVEYIADTAAAACMPDSMLVLLIDIVLAVIWLQRVQYADLLVVYAVCP
jgi:hypothetical protein